MALEDFENQFYRHGCVELILKSYFSLTRTN